MDTSFEEQNNEFDEIRFFKIDVEDIEASTLVDRFEPEVIPMFVFFRKGEEVDRVRGANESELRFKITKYSEPEKKELPAEL